MMNDVQSILRVCGIGNYLQVGCGQQALVFEFLKRSINAYGLDPSADMVNKHHERSPGHFLQGSLTNYPLETAAFDTVIVGTELLDFEISDLNNVFQALRGIIKRHLVLYFPPEALRFIANRQALSSRLFWEKLAIANGFRRHPREMLVTDYASLEDERTGTLTFFERIPDAAHEKFSMPWLLQNRDLHMDMLREAGRRSDAHVSRYIYAAEKIRPGDVVVDAACGLGYGTAVLAACSPGARFIGVDLDPDSVEYATFNYADPNPSITYHTSDVTNLAFLADQSVDTVVSFETLEHIENYDAFLIEVKRVLKPDGRFIGSVPHLWCDETGKDPNPYHFHVFDWNKLKEAIAKYFIVDDRCLQIAGGGYKLHHGKRIMQSIPVNVTDPIEAEWWIISACADPRNAKAIPYTNPFHKEHQQAAPALIDFAQYYENPWLYRTMVQLGERLTDRDVLVEFCIKVANEMSKGSADRGAALCVIAYQLLEVGHTHIDEIAALANAINTYDQTYDRSNPHACRWAISLHYVGARLILALGNHEEALTTFLTCAEMDPLQFCPLLATKTISARMYAGLLYVTKGDLEAARKQFRLGIHEAHRAMQTDWKTFLHSLDNPLPFGLQEAAEVVDLASQCAQALHALDKQTTVPGYFWDRINLKRFGLVEWNKSLERENQGLRQRLTARQPERKGAVA